MPFLILAIASSPSPSHDRRHQVHEKYIEMTEELTTVIKGAIESGGGWDEVQEKVEELHKVRRSGVRGHPPL